MAYDIYLGKNKSDVSKSMPSMSIEEEDFEKISNLFLNTNNNGILEDMFKDYYSDYCIQGGDLERLKNELLFMKKTFKNLNIFDKFLFLTEKAIKDNNNIYCFSD